MKNALTFVSIVLLATLSQAATVTWGSGTMYIPDANGSWSSTKAGTAAAKKVTAYYFVQDAAFTETAFDKYFDTDSATGVISLKSGKTATQVKTSAYAGNADGTSDIASNGTLYCLAFYTFTDTTNKKGWYISNTATAIYPDGALDPTITPDGNLCSSVGSASGWTSAAPVPEPTTVALLALGLAAVGLKRKIA